MMTSGQTVDLWALAICQNPESASAQMQRISAAERRAVSGQTDRVLQGSTI